MDCQSLGFHHLSSMLVISVFSHVSGQFCQIDKAVTGFFLMLLCREYYSSHSSSAYHVVVSGLHVFLLVVELFFRLSLGYKLALALFLLMLACVPTVHKAGFLCFQRLFGSSTSLTASSLMHGKNSRKHGGEKGIFLCLARTRARWNAPANKPHPLRRVSLWSH